jgi:pyruvate dehydrogenase E1 component beta subunit
MPETTTRTLTYAEAIREALAEEMRRDARVIIFGEDVAEAGTPFKVLAGLAAEFGTARVVDTPISEAGFTGLAVGAAMTGMRPVVDIMFGDFLTLTMDQVVNQAAKVHYMSGGALRVPMVLRTTLGAAALAVTACLVRPRPRAESRAPLDAVRRKGPAQERGPG